MQSLENLDAVMNHCIHCGMCLPVCPTYAITLQEQSSPRGRIRLMRSVYDGSLEPGRAFAEEMNFCLDCQACQTACPAGVHYGELVEHAREIVTSKKLDPFWDRFRKKFILNWVLSSPSKTKLAGRLLRWYEVSGIREGLERSHLLEVFSSRLASKVAMLPRASSRMFDEGGRVVPAQGKRRGKVAFLSGCIMKISFGDVHRDAIEVLSVNGFDVVIPELQVCCGSLHGHNGERQAAAELAMNNVEVFGRHEFDALITDSAGCGAFLKEYGSILSGKPEYAEAAENLSRNARDINEFLHEVGLVPGMRELKAKVTYHEACHLVHTQKISHQPKALLQAIPGLELVELPEATWCCGSAGIYNILRYDDSMKFLDRKIENIASTGAAYVATANPGCHMQIEYGIRKAQLNMEVVHPVSLLRRAYRAV